MRRLTLFALLLTACPTTTTCPDGQVWYPDMARCAPADGGVDAPVLDGGSDAGPCGVCDTATPFCDTTSMMCVECLMPTDCTGAGEAACVAGSCVACDSNDDCPAETPQCSATNTCEACTGNDGCMGRDDGGVCDSGTCVECLVNTDCGTMEGCVPETNTCRSYTMGGAALCGDCVADAECAAGQLCIPMMYDDPATPAADPVAVGNHCLWRSDASGTGAPNGACSTVRPYVSTQSLTSVDGVTTDVCMLRVSTCEAHIDIGEDCSPGGMPRDSTLCGRPAVSDGVCRMVDAASDLCTVYCTIADDCRAGLTCDSSLTPGQCRL